MELKATLNLNPTNLISDISFFTLFYQGSSLIHFLRKMYCVINILIIWPGYNQMNRKYSWWRHQMEKFPTLLAICAENSSVTGEFPAQRPVMRSFNAFFYLFLNKRLSKQSWGWWFGTPSRPLWRYRNVLCLPTTHGKQNHFQKNHYTFKC